MINNEMFKRLRKTHKLVGLLIIMELISFISSGCLAPQSKVSQWMSPNNVNMDQLYNAAVRSGAENGFTIINSDKVAGVISMRKGTYGAEGHSPERRMSVRLKQVGDTVEVSTKTSSSDFGIMAGAFEGKALAAETNNFYFYLFRELNINNPSAHNVVIEDEKLSYTKQESPVDTAR